jgi:radical SAM protein with 4Fe4S-binding SPASM domain
MLPPEKNRITRLFEQSGLKAGSATEAQAQIQLYKQYCLNKKCLNCAIGKYCIGGGDINRDYLMEG